MAESAISRCTGEISLQRVAAVAAPLAGGNGKTIPSVGWVASFFSSTYSLFKVENKGRFCLAL